MRTPAVPASAVLAAVVATLVSALAAATARAEIVTVYVLGHDFSINPPGNPDIQDAVISVGDTVRWNFTAPFHSTTSCVGTPEQWDSPIVLETPDTFDHTFTNVGVFHYFCAIHGFDFGNGTAGGMSGTITVLQGGPTCDSIDFNGDELFPDTQDIADFLLVFGGGACPTTACGDIDFNNDGLFPDTVDIDALLSVFAGGECI